MRTLPPEHKPRMPSCPAGKALNMQQAADKIAHGDDQQRRDWQHESLGEDNWEDIKQGVKKNAQSAFSGIARLGLLSSMRSSPSGNWMRSVAKVSASSSAKRLRETARLKALHRTPYPMVLSRMKLLLDRLQVFKNGGAARDGTISTALSMKSKVESAADTSMTDPFKIMEDASNLDTIDDGNGSKLSLEKILEELGILFSYVSEFLRKVPEETRLASTLFVKMENYKKDQVVFRIGEEPDKFYIILTGGVEIWTHPPGQPRHKTVIASLRKGQSFGDRAILNNEPRCQCATASGNSTFLTVERAPFEEIFGAYFQGRLQQANDFFLNKVEMLSKIPKADVMGVVRHMLLTIFPAGKEWDPMSEQQIYFITQGTASLESHDRKFPMVNVSRAMLGLQEDEEEALTLAETGHLANVVLRQGRAIGTLGHEEEMRRLRRQLIPKKSIATLDAGLYFGGGKDVMGEGELQSSLRVLANTEIEAYHCHIHTFFKHASPEMIRALRNDMAFKLTYYYGRIGCLGPHQVVGHPDSELALQLQVSGMDEFGLPSQQGVGQGQGSKSPGRRRKAQKHIHEPGRYAPEVEKAIQYIHSLQAHFEMVKSGNVDHHHSVRGRQAGAIIGGEAMPIPGHMEFLVSKGCTPAERFWATPAVSATARSNAIAPLLGQVFPEGLAPLSDKLDDLVHRSVRKAVQQASRPGTTGSMARPLSPGLMTDGQPDMAVLVDHLDQLLALAQSPLANADRMAQEGISDHKDDHDHEEYTMVRAFGPEASAASFSPLATQGVSPRTEAGPSASASSKGRGALSGDGGFSFAVLGGGAEARPQASVAWPPSSSGRDRGGQGSSSSKSCSRAFGHPTGASGARLDEALKGSSTPLLHAPSTSGAGLGSSGLIEQPIGSIGEASPLAGHSVEWVRNCEEEGVSRTGFRGAGLGRSGRNSSVASSNPNHNSTMSYNTLLDSKARKRGALMASGVVWARNQDLSAAPALRQCLTYEEIARLRAHLAGGSS